LSQGCLPKTSNIVIQVLPLSYDINFRFSFNYYTCPTGQQCLFITTIHNTTRSQDFHLSTVGVLPTFLDGNHRFQSIILLVGPYLVLIDVDVSLHCSQTTSSVESDSTNFRLSSFVLLTFFLLKLNEIHRRATNKSNPKL